MISISTLSEAENISPVFLEQIFFKLRKAGIVKSARGPGGGFSFSRPLEAISVKELLYFAGEELDVLPCDRQKGDCSRVSECISHKVLTIVTGKINDYLDNITMRMLLENDEFKP